MLSELPVSTRKQWPIMLSKSSPWTTVFSCPLHRRFPASCKAAHRKRRPPRTSSVFDAEVGGQPGLLGSFRLRQPGGCFTAPAVPAAASLPEGGTAATLPVSRDGGHEIRLRILLHGRHTAAAAVVVVEGPQLIRLCRQHLRVLVVGLGQQDLDLPGQPLKEDAGEEIGFFSPLGQVSSIAAISSDGFLPPRTGIWNSLSTFWKSDSW
jgi:hypothetical protein